MASFKGGGLQLKTKASTPSADTDSTIVYSDGFRCVTVGEFNEEIAFLSDFPISTGIAGEVITMNRAVFIKDDDGLVYYATNDTPSDVMIFIAGKGASIGESLNLKFDGEVVTETYWTWTPGKLVYVGMSNGTLIQTAPTSGTIFIIGVALSATSIRINNQRAILTV